MRYPEVHRRWEWQLRSAPERLWPLIADTDRFNRDTGLPAVERIGAARRNARRRLGLRRFGVRIVWDEEPFEWARPYRFGVRRRYRRGPLATMRVTAELRPTPEGGTLLRYSTWVRPRNLLGLLGVPLVMRLHDRRRFGAVFRRYDRMAALDLAATLPERAPTLELAPGARERIATARRELTGGAGSPALVARLLDAMERGDGLVLGRLRPYALADAWNVPRREVVEACLSVTRAGLFDLQWDVLCPLCRGARATSTTLAETPERVHCDACNIDFGANFERSIELTFRPGPAIRAADAPSYCVGGPLVTPHIVAQQLVPAGAERSVALRLEPGRYRLRTLGDAGGRFLVAGEDGARELTLTASCDGWPPDEPAVALAPGLRLVNACDAERLFILERMAWSDQALTAADVIGMQVFRDLFAGELLRPGEHIAVGSVTILFTDLRDSTQLYRQIGDAVAFARVRDHFAVLREAVSAEEGLLVKTIGDSVMAVFRRPIAGLRAVLRAQAQLARPNDGAAPFYLKAGLHYGPCLAVTQNERLDYFGSVVNMAARLERFSSGQDIIISDAVHTDPEIAALLADPTQAFHAEPFATRLKGFDDAEFRLWRVGSA